MRAVIEARVMVTKRAPALQCRRPCRAFVGLPYHWGRKGLVTGDSANDLLPIALDPNVHIQETKGLTCDIRLGAPSARPGNARSAARDSERATRRGEDMTLTIDLTSGDVGGRRKSATYHGRRGTAAGFSPIRRSASAAKPARSRAKSGTIYRRTVIRLPACRTIIPAS